MNHKIERIEKCQKFYSNAYNHDYDGYLFVQDDGNFIAPILQEGVDIRDLQDWLGHQSVSSTNRDTRSDY